jgi:hypothetical protein
MRVVMLTMPFMDRLFINIKIDSGQKSGSPPGEHQQGINGLLGS